MGRGQGQEAHGASARGDHSLGEVVSYIEEGLRLLEDDELAGSEAELTEALGRTRAWTKEHPIRVADDETPWSGIAHHVSHPLGVMRVNLQKGEGLDARYKEWARKHLRAAIECGRGNETYLRNLDYGVH